MGLVASVVRGLGSVKRWLHPNEDRFFGLLERAAACLHDCTRDSASCFSVGDPMARSELIAAVDRHDQAAQEVIRATNVELGKTFITPFDRGDIWMLARGLEKVVDCLTETLRLIDTHLMTALPEESVALGRLLLSAGEKVVAGIGLLRSHGGLSKLGEIAQEIRVLEHDGDVIHRAALKRIFGSPAEPLEVIKSVAFLDGLERALDACEALAQTLENVSIRNC